MKALVLFVGWCILFVLCWPLAVLALILFPFVWLVSLPFRLVGITMQAVFALLRALLFLPARLLGWRRSQRHAV
jgi:biotin transporter BioY